MAERVYWLLVAGITIVTTPEEYAVVDVLAPVDSITLAPFEILGCLATRSSPIAEAELYIPELTAINPPSVAAYKTPPVYKF